MPKNIRDPLTKKIGDPTGKKTPFDGLLSRKPMLVAMALVDTSFLLWTSPFSVVHMAPWPWKVKSQKIPHMGYIPIFLI